MQPPSTEGTPIAAVKIQQPQRTATLVPQKKQDTSNGYKTIVQTKSKSDNEESQAEEVADLEKMRKTPLKVKGTKDSTKKAKATKDKEKSTASDSWKKKATFAEMVGKETVEEKKIDYKTCVVGFAVRVDKGKDQREDLTRSYLKDLPLCKLIPTNTHHSILLGRAKT